ncbi:MAG: C40 family peptidase [Casimicrobiaceae bacterium]
MSKRVAAALLAAVAVLARPTLSEANPPGPVTDIAGSRSEATSVVQSPQELAIYALGLIGVDYRYGGDSPVHGLDCSGLVRYVFQQVTGAVLPRTSREIARLGGRVAAADLQPGDLVFFNTLKSPFSHVGIYLGDNRFIHAPHRGGEVEIAAMTQRYWRTRYQGARRLIGGMPDAIVPAQTAPAETVVPPGTNPYGEAGR